MIGWLSSTCVACLFLIEPTLARADSPGANTGVAGTLPSDASGRTLNLGFETGTLADWTAQGPAFEGQPVEGDTAAGAEVDMHSGHVGSFWVGTYERGGDYRQGQFDFRAVPASRKPYPSFLAGGGSRMALRGRDRQER